MFLPTTKSEILKLGWDTPDIILVTGDTYIDSPFMGISVIGKLLASAGFRVGIIAQPDVDSDKDIGRLGEPGLFWGVSGGCIDSMVANYTPVKKRRKKDDFTPGGINNRRPDRAVIVYTNLIRRYFKSSPPIVLGGIEASLRRVPHYDFWSDRIRRSILFDSKADFILYGMAEKPIVEFAQRLASGKDVTSMGDLCYISKTKKRGFIDLPSFQETVRSKQAFINMFHTFYENNDPATAKGLCQKHDTRYLIHNPPAPYLSSQELDRVYDLDFERAQHPYYAGRGDAKALETIKNSLTTHQGCYGECNFCSISIHQGRTVRWRTEQSILHEAKQVIKHPDFKGTIHDAGGPTANMYGFECAKKLKKGVCKNRRCLFPDICPQLRVNHTAYSGLLTKLTRLDKVKKVFIGSGIRYDMVLSDKKNGLGFLKQVVGHHVSGQLKTAPEHTEDKVLSLMGKCSTENLLEFKRFFDNYSKQANKKQFLTYYMIAAHPGCSTKDMIALKQFAGNKLRINPRQVQIFTPTPSTYSSLMYYTEKDPFTGKKIFVEKDNREKERQKNILTQKTFPGKSKTIAGEKRK